MAKIVIVVPDIGAERDSYDEIREVKSESLSRRTRGRRNSLPVRRLEAEKMATEIERLLADENEFLGARINNLRAACIFHNGYFDGELNEDCQTLNKQYFSDDLSDVGILLFGHDMRLQRD